MGTVVEQEGWGHESGLWVGSAQNQGSGWMHGFPQGILRLMLGLLAALRKKGAAQHRLGQWLGQRLESQPAQTQAQTQGSPGQEHKISHYLTAIRQAVHRDIPVNLGLWSPGPISGVWD